MPPRGNHAMRLQANFLLENAAPALLCDLNEIRGSAIAKESLARMESAFQYQINGLVSDGTTIRVSQERNREWISIYSIR